MEDGEIIELYWQRDQQAIQETAGKYGGFLHGIAWNILRSHGDAEECVNDTYLRTSSALFAALPRESRVIFLRRYWFGDDLATIAVRLGYGEGKVKSSLFRSRNTFWAYLEREGVSL